MKTAGATATISDAGNHCQKRVRLAEAFLVPSASQSKSQGLTADTQSVRYRLKDARLTGLSHSLKRNRLRLLLVHLNTCSASVALKLGALTSPPSKRRLRQPTSSIPRIHPIILLLLHPSQRTSTTRRPLPPLALAALNLSTLATFRRNPRHTCKAPANTPVQPIRPSRHAGPSIALRSLRSRHATASHNRVSFAAES